MSLLTSLILAGLLAAPATAFWRLPCASPLVQERADPIVNPGAVSGHLHTIMGGNGFDFNMDYSSTQASTCTSCTVHGDFSNYWTPVLYYRHQDGTFEKVDQVGGATVYYLQRAGGNEQLKAFPEGFRMLAGDPSKRSGGTDFPSQAVSYNCLNYNGPAEPETGGFPTHNCANGIRSQIFFPSCWDGKNLDSPDHKSHMAYPIGAYNSGSCPSSHPVHLISIFYEIIWDTNKFANKWYGSSQPFVWSMGDPTGYGFHGDFVNGWDVNLLQKAVDQCTNLSGRVEDCPVFQLYDNSVAQGCRLASKVNDQIDGIVAQLPGCNPVQAGPAAAAPAAAGSCKATTTIEQSSAVAAQFFTDLTSQDWSYTGCATDNYYSRSLTGASTTANNMTNAVCAAFCQAKGFSIAGTEYSRECYCGNSLPQARMPTAGVVGNCNMACSGDASEWCGGAGLMSLYQKCTGATCANAQFGPSGSSSGGSAPNSGATTPSKAAPSAASSASPTVVSPIASSATVRTMATSSKAITSAKNIIASTPSAMPTSKAATTAAASSSTSSPSTSASTSASASSSSSSSASSSPSTTRRHGHMTPSFPANQPWQTMQWESWKRHADSRPHRHMKRSGTW